MKSSSTSRVIISKSILKQRNNNSNSSQRFTTKNFSTIKTNFKTQSEELNTSWDFTPFPDLYFPSQKRHIIKKLNGFDFKKVSTMPINIDYKQNIKNMFNINIDSNKYKNRRNRTNFQIDGMPNIQRSNSVFSLYQEKRGDITKHSSPCYSFGTSREDCKFPILKFQEKISPSPCAYNLRPLEGLGGDSLKFSFGRDKSLRQLRRHIDPGPGHYNLEKYDLKNNGNFVLSNMENSKVMNFGKYEERTDNISRSDFNIKPEPASYNINDNLTMFSGNGYYALSRFRSNIAKSINKFRGLSKKIKFIYPGPGEYNHHSIFKSSN